MYIFAPLSASKIGFRALVPYKPITMKQTKEKPKHTKGLGTNGHRDRGWTDAGITRFAELIELVRAQRSGNDRAR